VTDRESLPRFIAPMLLTATPEVPADPGWALEVKWDGMRAQLRYDGRRVALRSRPGRDCTSQFPELYAITDALGPRVVLDGELVCFDATGLPDFERLRSRLRARTPASVDAAQTAAPATLISPLVVALDHRSQGPMFRASTWSRSPERAAQLRHAKEH
jgi:bifunctional non-homologous end joining protein LigD